MILLQILDEGSLTDSQGRKVDFKVRCFPLPGRNCVSMLPLLLYMTEHNHLPHE